MNFKQFLVESKTEISKKDDIKNKLIDFFISNPNPQDTTIHKMAEKLGIDVDKIETNIYSILSDFLTGGKSKGKELEDNPLKDKAIEIKTEHTNNLRIAKKIVADHIAEHGWKYYKELIKMEDMLSKK